MNNKVSYKAILDSNFDSACERVALMIEESLHRKREIVAVTLAPDQHRFYGVVFYREQE